MKILVVVLLFTATFTLSQQLYRNNTYDSLAILLISNGQHPSAVLTENNDIVCTATNWIEHFPLIAERINGSGKLLWNNVQVSKPQNSLDQNGIGTIILPRSDGGAYFIFTFDEYRYRENHAQFYASYPHIQLVDYMGNPQWGTDGIRLTNLIVSHHNLVRIRAANYNSEGDIIVYWDWFEIDSTSNTKQGVYSQKINSITGQLLWGNTGKKIFDNTSWFITTNSKGLVFIDHRDSVICFDSEGKTLWDYPLLTGIKNGHSILSASNVNGDLLILYDTDQDLRGRLIDATGFLVWSDKILTNSIQRILPSTQIVGWGNDRWIIKSGQIGNSICCVDRNGITLWEFMEINRILTAIPVDDESIFVSYQKPREDEESVYDLVLQKIDKSGRIVWNTEGVKLFHNISVNCRILPDYFGGAYIIFDALTQYEPIYRARGVYLQKVDKNGIVNIITSVNNEKKIVGANSINSLVCYPNPSREITNFILKVGDKVQANELVIYDILGRRIKIINYENSSTEEIFFRWDGTESSGRKAAPGIYFFNVKTTNKLVINGKVLRLK